MFLSLYDCQRFCCGTFIVHFTLFIFFFFNDTATTEIYTLSLHDALPISEGKRRAAQLAISRGSFARTPFGRGVRADFGRSEEHTSELQSHSDLVCRLLLEKKKEPNDHTRRHKTRISRCITSRSTLFATVH